jgi:hypothetical protein
MNRKLAERRCGTYTDITCRVDAHALPHSDRIEMGIEREIATRVAIRTIELFTCDYAEISLRSDRISKTSEPD